MRKNFFFLMVMLCSVMAVAQNTNQAPVWTWSYNLYDHEYDYLATVDEVWIEDSIVGKNGKKYARMGMWRYCYFPVRPTTSEFFTPRAKNKKYVSVRSEGDLILVDKEEYMAFFDTFWQKTGDKDFIPYKTNDAGELILYDFSKQAGEEYCTLQDGTLVTVTRVATLENSDGVRQRKLFLSNGLKLVEGVGCINSAGTFFFYLNPSPKSLAGFSFLQRVEDGSSNYLYLGDPFELVDDQKAFRASHVSTGQPGDNSLLKIGKQWNEYYTNGHYEGSMVYTIDGDSLINGERYFTVGALLIDQWTGDTLSTGRLPMLLCERGQRIFCRDTSGERLLYDFGLDAGEKAEDGESRVTEVTAVDTIRVLGKRYRRQEVRKSTYVKETPYSESVEYWVEGIGSSHGLFDASGNTLLTCVDEGKCVFTGKNFEQMPSDAVSPDYRPLVAEGREWIYHDEHDNPAFRLFIQGDTIIDGATWKRVLRDDLTGGAPTYEKAIRESDRHVYQKRAAEAPELLFNYTLRTGARFTPSDADDRYAEVVMVDTVMSGGQPCRRFILRQYLGGVETGLSCWIEGVGGDCGIDIPVLWSDMSARYKERGYSLYPYLFCACVDGGKTIYGQTLGISAVSEPMRTGSSRLYNLHGHPIASPPAKGIYIHDGKKRVAR